MDSSAQWGLLLGIHNHQLLYIPWHVGFRDPVDCVRKTTALLLFYITLWFLVWKLADTCLTCSFFPLVALQGRGECLNSRPPVLVAAQHINKRQVSAFRELGARSLVRINSSLAGKGIGHVLTRATLLSASEKVAAQITSKAFSVSARAPVVFPHSLFVLVLGMKRGHVTIWGSCWDALWCRVAVIAHLLSRLQLGAWEWKSAYMFENWPPGLG